MQHISAWAFVNTPGMNSPVSVVHAYDKGTPWKLISVSTGDDIAYQYVTCSSSTPPTFKWFI